MGGNSWILLLQDKWGVAVHSSQWHHWCPYGSFTQPSTSLHLVIRLVARSTGDRALSCHTNQPAAHQHVCPISSPYGRSSYATGQDCLMPRDTAARGARDEAAASCCDLLHIGFFSSARQQDDGKTDERHITAWWHNKGKIWNPGFVFLPPPIVSNSPFSPPGGLFQLFIAMSPSKKCWTPWPLLPT